MKLVKARIKNFRGISGEVEISFDSYNVIVGQNDAGKSTVLKALNAFINDKDIDKDSANVNTDNGVVEIELYFDPQNAPIIIDEQIETTFEAEGLTTFEGYVVLKKVWNTSSSRIASEFSFLRKKYGTDDFLLLTEAQLMALCKRKGIDTSKGNGVEFNNVEKRGKLRELLQMDEAAFTYEFEKPPASGASRAKNIADVMKGMMPRFEYFKADSSLEETDTSIQNYFKKIALQEIEQCETELIQSRVAEKLSAVMKSISGKINQVVTQTESVEPEIKFDWTKLVQTAFRSKADESDIPLKNRGDGFRRITMMAYFEHLADEGSKGDAENVIYGFEEPETFLHPSAQEQLFLRLKMVSEDSAQVLVTTHSPVIVAHSDKDKLIHVTKQSGGAVYEQNLEDCSGIIKDLGISPNRMLLDHLDSAKLLLLVEGPDDIVAFEHLAACYKRAGLINADFVDMGIVLIPIGGCDSIQHWINYDVVKSLNKPFFIILDSDKDSEFAVSKNLTFLVASEMIDGKDFHILRKRAIENYIDLGYFARRFPSFDVSFGPFDQVKDYSKKHTECIKLGGGKIANKHFCNQNINELRVAMHFGGSDEFIHIVDCLNKQLDDARKAKVHDIWEGFVLEDSIDDVENA